MIISRTPFRVSFLGGGTDYPGWYRNHGGAVLATTIDKYCYLSVRYLPPFFDHRIRIVYSAIENCRTVEEIKHPAVRAILQQLNLDRGIEIHHDGDLPARSGMGSSSAFTVGLINALYALNGKMRSKKQLADEAIFVEQERLKEVVGSQDQVLAAYGGFNHITFETDGSIHCRPMTISATRMRELESHLMLFYTGIKRTAANVAISYTEDMDTKRRQLRIMKDLVDEGIVILSNGKPITAFGELLHEAWKAKRSLSDKVSNPEVDAVYDAALSAGAIGGKLIGAGGGGFFLIFAPPERQMDVISALGKLIHVPFRFENNGSQIIFYDVERDYAAEDRVSKLRGHLSFKELSEDETKDWPK